MGAEHVPPPLTSGMVVSIATEIADAPTPAEVHRLLLLAGLGPLLAQSWHTAVLQWSQRVTGLYCLTQNLTLPASASVGLWLLSPHHRLMETPPIRHAWAKVQRLLGDLAFVALRARLVQTATERVLGAFGHPPESATPLAAWVADLGVAGWLALPVAELDADPPQDESARKWMEAEGSQTSAEAALAIPPWTAKGVWRRGSGKVPAEIAPLVRAALVRAAAIRALAEELRASQPVLRRPDPEAFPQLAALFDRAGAALRVQEAALGPRWEITPVASELVLHLDPPIAMWVDPRGSYYRWDEEAVSRGLRISLRDPRDAVETERQVQVTGPSVALRDALRELLVQLSHPQLRPSLLRLESDLALSPLDRFLRDLAPALAPDRPLLGLELRSDLEGPWLALLAVDPSGGGRSKTRAVQEIDPGSIVDAHEQRVLSALTGGMEPHELPASSWKAVQHRRDRIAETLLAARGMPHQYVKGEGRHPLVLRQGVLSLSIDHDERTRIALRLDGVALNAAQLGQFGGTELAGPLLFIDWERGVVTVVPCTGAQRALAQALQRRGGDLGEELTEELISRLPALHAVAPLELGPSLRGPEVAAEARLVVRLELLADGLTMSLFARVFPRGELLHPGRGLVTVYGSGDGGRVHAHRDLKDEHARALALQESLGLDKPDDSRLGWRWTLLDHLMAGRTIAALAERDDVTLEWQGRPGIVRHAPRIDRLRVRFSTLGEWFGVSGELALTRGKVQLAELLLAAEQGRHFVTLAPGEWLRLSDELLDALRPLAASVRASPDGASVSRLHAPLLVDLPASGAQIEAPPEWLQWLDRAAEAAVLEPVLPEDLVAELRLYQRQGFVWLARLAHWAGGAVLADDMGLGKTVQALALLLHRAADGPALVVAPASVGFNWARECARFAPSLRVIEYQGARRTGRLLEAAPGTLFICTWAVLASDVEVLAQATWSTIVFDEAQAMKNLSTNRNRAARSLPARFRLALTGTPVENHAGELHALLGVVVPGLLGGSTQFRARFLAPIARDEEGAKAALARLVAPFVLRRLKRDVAQELPDRSEIEVFVELSRGERALYEQVRKAALAELQLASSLQEQQRRFRALGLLTRLRQAACHPRLIDPQSEVPSSKLERAIELLEELREEGNKALVFSQFTSHLGLVRDALAARGWKLLYLDGSTPTAQRAGLVDAFQAGEADAFLISLKAGGTGLNLTAATYVIHLDPWWNPAVEDQATDRSHRIGQDRAVTVYRLIARDSVEESIVRMHGRKRELADALLAGAGSGSALSPAELVALFASQGATDGGE